MGGELATLGISLYGLLSSQDLPLAFVLTYLVFNLVIFTALGFCYINFVGLSIASLRIRILQELLAHPEGLTLEKILESYNPKVLIDNRIGRLTSGGQLVDKDGRFQTGRRHSAGGTHHAIGEVHHPRPPTRLEHYTIGSFHKPAAQARDVPCLRCGLANEGQRGHKPGTDTHMEEDTHTWDTRKEEAEDTDRPPPPAAPGRAAALRRRPCRWKCAFACTL